MSTSTDITWHDGAVDRKARWRTMGQGGATVWLTGLSGSGKSTVAVEVERRLVEAGHHAYRLDGDNVRHGLCGDLGFSLADRAENNRRVGHVARLMADAGLIVLCSFVSPMREDRDRIRAMHEEASLAFLEVFVDVPLEVAEGRDPKGLYAKARRGEIPDFTGIHQAFEQPEHAELVLPTHELSVGDASGRVVEMLRERGVIE